MEWNVLNTLQNVLTAFLQTWIRLKRICKRNIILCKDFFCKYQMTNVYKERMNVNCIRKILYRCTYFSILYLCKTYGKKFWFKSRTIIIRLKYLKEGFFLLNFANLLMSSCSCQKIIPFKNILIDKKSVTKTKTRTSF